MPLVQEAEAPRVRPVEAPNGRPPRLVQVAGQLIDRSNEQWPRRESTITAQSARAGDVRAHADRQLAAGDRRIDERRHVAVNLHRTARSPLPSARRPARPTPASGPAPPGRGPQPSRHAAAGAAPGLARRSAPPGRAEGRRRPPADSARAARRRRWRRAGPPGRASAGPPPPPPRPAARRSGATRPRERARTASRVRSPGAFSRAQVATWGGRLSARRGTARRPGRGRRARTPASTRRSAGIPSSTRASATAARALHRGPGRRRAPRRRAGTPPPPPPAPGAAPPAPSPRTHRGRAPGDPRRPAPPRRRLRPRAAAGSGAPRASPRKAKSTSRAVSPPASAHRVSRAPVAAPPRPRASPRAAPRAAPSRPGAPADRRPRAPRRAAHLPAPPGTAPRPPTPPRGRRARPRARAARSPNVPATGDPACAGRGNRARRAPEVSPERARRPGGRRPPDRHATPPPPPRSPPAPRGVAVRSTHRATHTARRRRRCKKRGPARRAPGRPSLSRQGRRPGRCARAADLRKCRQALIGSALGFCSGCCSGPRTTSYCLSRRRKLLRSTPAARAALETLCPLFSSSAER